MGGAVRATGRLHPSKLASVTEQEQTFESGRISGLFDGEGHLVGQFEKALSHRRGFGVGFSQNPGAVLDEVCRWAQSRGFDCGLSRVDGNNTDRVNGGLKEVLRLLMMVRPERLIEKFQKKAEGCSIYGRSGRTVVGLVGKEFLGERDVVAMETSARSRSVRVLT